MFHLKCGWNPLARRSSAQGVGSSARGIKVKLALSASYEKKMKVISGLRGIATFCTT